MQQHDWSSRDMTIVCRRPYRYMQRGGQKLSLKNQIGLAKRPRPWSRTNSCLIDVRGKLQRMFPYRGSKLQNGHNPLPTAGRIPPPDKHCHKMLQPKSPYPFNVPISYTRRENLFVQSLKFALYSSDCDFACVCAKQIPIWFRIRINGYNLCAQIKYFSVHIGHVVQLLPMYCTKVNCVDRMSNNLFVQ
jgi:hypothetical protein